MNILVTCVFENVLMLKAEISIVKLFQLTIVANGMALDA